MADPRYQYEKANAIKIIIENSEGKVLLIKEPLNFEWMPGHWGLPGGKALVKESLYETFIRKSREDLGLEMNLVGLYKIEELLMDGRTVFIYHVIAKTQDYSKIKGEIEDYKWFSADDVERMDISEFTEYFNKDLLLNYLKGEKETVSFNLIESQYFYKMENDPEYQRWKKSGTRKT